jgi:hypothetical protein
MKIYTTGLSCKSLKKKKNGEWETLLPKSDTIEKVDKVYIQEDLNSHEEILSVKELIQLDKDEGSNSCDKNTAEC